MKAFLPSRFSSFSLPASTDSTPVLSPSQQGHHSAGFDKCHLFLKVALEKGNLTAVRQNRELNASRPLSTRTQPQEQNTEERSTAWGSQRSRRLSWGTCALCKSLQYLGPRVGSPPPSFPLPALCRLLLVSWLVTKGPQQRSPLWGWEPSPPWAAD